MKKKIVSMLCGFAIILPLMYGCSTEKSVSEGKSSKAEEVTETKDTKSDEKKEIKVYVYAQDHEKAVYQSLIDEYSKETGINVTFEVTTSEEYGDRMTALKRAATMPDIFYVGTNDVADNAHSGYLLPLDEYIQKDTLSDLWPVIVDAYKTDGVVTGSGPLYCLPKDLSTFAFAYNKDLFDKAGLDYPNPVKPYTFDEFLEVCKKLTKDNDGDGKKDQWGAAFANAYGLTPFIYSNGATFLDDKYENVVIDGQENFIEALQYYADMTAVHGVTPTVQEDVEIGGYQRWIDGTLGFYACGTWDVGAFMNNENLKFKWDLCGWPVGKSGKSKTWNGTVGFAVSAKTKYPKECVDLITKLSTDIDGQKVLCGETTGTSLQIPNIMSYAKGAFTDKVKDGTIPYAPSVDVIFGYIEGNDKYEGVFTESTYTYNSEWWDIFLAGVPDLQAGTKTAKDYCKEVQPNMQDSLNTAVQLKEDAAKNK